MTSIEHRRSVRKYLDKPVEEEKLRCVLESARLAPSGSNTQPWRFIVVRSRDTMEKLVKADHNQQWMLTAPLFIVCVADSRCRIANTEGLSFDENSPEPELKQLIRDTASAIENLLLEADCQGLSTCWTGWYDQKDIKPILGIPDSAYVCGVIVLGYGAEQPSPRPRHALGDIVCSEKWDFPRSL